MSRIVITAYGLLILSGCSLPLLQQASPASASREATTTGVPSGSPSLSIYKNIEYHSPGCTRNRLDLYLPGARERSGVTVLYIHGGGWLQGDKEGAAGLLEALAVRDFPVVSCNYTLSTVDSAGFPQAVFDVKAVVRWIRTEGSSVYSLPSKIVVVGESAGGYLALMLGTTDGIARFEPQGPFDGGYRVDGVIDFFGPGDLVYQAMQGFDWFATAFFLGGLINDQWMPLYVEASPSTYVSEACPPMALLHGRMDTVVPFESSLRWQQALANVCRSCQLFEAPGAGHGMDGFGGNEGAAEIISDLVPGLLSGRAEPDLNGDGRIDALDAGLFVEMLVDPDSYFGIHVGCDRLQADRNDDGLVDGRDIAFMVRRLVMME